MKPCICELFDYASSCQDTITCPICRYKIGYDSIHKIYL